MSAPPEQSRPARQVRSRTRTRPTLRLVPKPEPAPNLNALFGLDRLAAADADELLRARVLNHVEGRYAYHAALGHWLRMWGRLDDRREYVVMHGFVAVVTWHEDTKDWSWSVARELQRGAQPGPRLAVVSHYNSDLAAKMAAYDFATALLEAETRPGEPR